MNPRAAVNRRDLLRRARSGSPATLPAAPPPGSLLNASRPAMGTHFEVRLPVSTPGGAALACRALDRIEALEAQMTVYRDDSEIARINATAHEAPVHVEPGLFALLERAQTIGEETGGAYDVASGALSLAWGFTRGPRRVPSPEERADALARTGRRHVSLDRENRTVGFDRPGIVLNLGSIGKGHALDEAARLIAEYPWPVPALIHGGQSSVYALGSPPWDFGGRWGVSLRNPFEPTRPLGQFFLRNRGLGTSGAAFQQFEENGRLYGHIIDPRTGEPPASGPASVSVLAPTAAEADGLSTAFYLMGPSATAEYLKSRPEVAALFVLPAEGRRPPRAVRLNLTPEDFEPAPDVRLAVASD